MGLYIIVTCVVMYGFNYIIIMLLTTILRIIVAYHQYMREHGGSIVNITVDNFSGMPYMRSVLELEGHESWYNSSTLLQIDQVF